MRSARRVVQAEITAGAKVLRWKLVHSIKDWFGVEYEKRKEAGEVGGSQVSWVLGARVRIYLGFIPRRMGNYWRVLCISFMIQILKTLLLCEE